MCAQRPQRCVDVGLASSDWQMPPSAQMARYFPVAVFYPIVYWMLMAVITVLMTPRGLFRTTNRGRPTTWRTKREPLAESKSAVTSPSA